MVGSAVAKTLTIAVPPRPPLFLVRANTSFASISEEEGDEPALLTAREVADILRVHPKKVYELSLAQVRLSPRRVRWLRTDVRAYINRQRVGR